MNGVWTFVVLLLVDVFVFKISGLNVTITYSFSLPSELGVDTPSTENCCAFAVLHSNDTQGLAPPSVLGLGTQKGGTTTLHKYFSKNPLFETPLWKELNFLASSKRKMTYQKYLTFWRSNRLQNRVGIEDPEFQNYTDSKTLFEVTPNYLMLPFSACRAKHHFPSAKLIVILREPVERTYSSFLYTQWVYGHQTNDTFPDWKVRGFLEVVMNGIPLIQSDQKCDFTNGKNDKTLQDCIGCLLHSFDKLMQCNLRPMAVVKDAENAFQCLAFDKELLLRSFYAAQLARWFTFFPPDQFYIINSEQLFKDRLGEMTRMMDFLGLSQKYTKQMVKSSVKANQYKSKWRPDPERVLVGKSLLKDFFQRPNLELYRLLTETSHGSFLPFEKELRDLETLNCSAELIQLTGFCPEGVEESSINSKAQIGAHVYSPMWSQNYEHLGVFAFVLCLVIFIISRCQWRSRHTNKHRSI